MSVVQLILTTLGCLAAELGFVLVMTGVYYLMSKVSKKEKLV